MIREDDGFSEKAEACPGGHTTRTRTRTSTIKKYIIYLLLGDISYDVTSHEKKKKKERTVCANRYLPMMCYSIVTVMIEGCSSLIRLDEHIYHSRWKHSS